MPRRPRPITYRELIDILHEMRLTLRTMLRTPQLLAEVKAQLDVPADRIGGLLARDDKRDRDL